jgi:hypothetical protein
VALQRVIKNKAAKQQQKQQAILQEIHASFTAQVRAAAAAAIHSASPRLPWQGLHLNCVHCQSLLCAAKAAPAAQSVAVLIAVQCLG